MTLNRPSFFVKKWLFGAKLFLKMIANNYGGVRDFVGMGDHNRLSGDHFSVVSSRCSQRHRGTLSAFFYSEVLLVQLPYRKQACPPVQIPSFSDARIMSSNYQVLKTLALQEQKKTEIGIGNKSHEGDRKYP